MAELHIRYDGQSTDIDMDSLDIGDLSTDREIKEAVAVHLDVPYSKLQNFSVDKSDTGDVTLRPQANFG